MNLGLSPTLLNQRLNLKPFVRTINFTGGSTFDFTNINGSSRRNFIRSLVIHAIAQSKGKYHANYNPTGTSYGFSTIGTYEFATYGASTPTIQATHLAEINANPADLVFMLCGLNDLGNGSATAALTFSRIQTYYGALKQAGHKNIAIGAITPRRSTFNPNGTDGKPIVIRNVETNALLSSWCAANKIPFCDWYNVLNDGSGFLRTDLSYDDTHVNTLGAQKMGAFLGSFIQSNFRTGPSPYNSSFLASLNPESVCTSGWTNSQFGSGGSAVQSTVPGTDGLGDWRRITTNNPNLAVNTTYFDRLNIPIPASWNHVNGQLLQPIIELRLENEAICSIEATVQNGTMPISCLNINNYEIHQPFESVFFGQPFVANTSTLFRFTLALRGTVAMDVRRFGFRKVDSMYPPYIFP
jgi:lysophospholipase L1-like esterase